MERDCLIAYGARWVINANQIGCNIMMCRVMFGVLMLCYVLLCLTMPFHSNHAVHFACYSKGHPPYIVAPHKISLDNAGRERRLEML